MISFLFWNIRKKPLQAKIANLASLHEIDLIMLTESSIPPAVMLSTLNQDRGYDYHYAANIGCKKVDIFTKFPSNFLFPIFETERLTIRKLALPGQTDILLAVTHFPSKLYWDESSQCSESIELSTMIKEAEKNIGHSRTVLVGDFNMNPFEDGVINANGLHAVMTRGIAKKGKRIVQAKEYPMFYNPMWAFFGERQSVRFSE